MLVYDDIENYKTWKKQFKRFNKVTVLKTKYSIKIVFGNKKVYLSKGDMGQTNILGLINKVKNDVTKYINKESIETVRGSDIFWYYYNENNDKKEEKFEVAKIDLTSAYWTKAINNGIISKETQEYFEGLNFSDIKEKKSARLKAFGSLATVKSTEIYEYGKRSKEFIPPVMNELFRSVYMGICKEVSEDMQQVLGRVNGVYYYWDMIFVELDSTNEVGEIFKAMGYNFTIEKDVAEVVESDLISYLYCYKTGVKYPLN